MKQASEETLKQQLAVAWPDFQGAGRLRGVVFHTSSILDKVAGFIIVLSMFLIIANIFMRAVFNSPILGTMELVGFLTAVAIAWALAQCALGEGHIAINLIVDRLPAWLQTLVGTSIHLLSVIFLGACGWGLFLLGGSNAASGLVGATTQIPVYPFIYLVALGFFVFALAQLTQLVDSLGKGGR